MSHPRPSSNTEKNQKELEQMNEKLRIGLNERKKIKKKISQTTKSYRVELKKLETEKSNLLLHLENIKQTFTVERAALVAEIEALSNINKEHEITRLDQMNNLTNQFQHEQSRLLSRISILKQENLEKQDRVNLLLEEINNLNSSFLAEQKKNQKEQTDHLKHAEEKTTLLQEFDNRLKEFKQQVALRKPTLADMIEGLETLKKDEIEQIKILTTHLTQPVTPKTPVEEKRSVVSLSAEKLSPITKIEVEPEMKAANYSRLSLWYWIGSQPQKNGASSLTGLATGTDNTIGIKP